ncbi:hypothetical protein ACFZC5_34675 [Nocardia gamkensis]|uniref:hypothetical protein n=1 Tax=Nocardia gamkensis TaxID=352869 RepID=UPI0036E6C746
MDVDLVPAGWRALVFRDGRAPETVDRTAYVFCVLHLFRKRPRRLDIFAAASISADPRAAAHRGGVGIQTRIAAATRRPRQSCPARLPPGSTQRGGTPPTAPAAVRSPSVTTARLHAAAFSAIAEPATLIDLRR